jgi:TRAP-type C4-dicarboxylate transport system permease small subunit
MKTLLTKVLEFFLIVVVALLVLDVVWGVVTRYAFGQQATWTEELARFLLIWVTLLGAAVAFGQKGHLGVDYFMERLHPEARKLMAVISHLVVIFFAIAIFIYGGVQVVSGALTMEQVTPSLGWKMGHVYLALPVSGMFILMFALDNLVESIADFKTAPKVADGDVG